MGMAEGVAVESYRLPWRHIMSYACCRTEFSHTRYPATQYVRLNLVSPVTSSI